MKRTKPQTCRLRKCSCECGYTIRVTRAWMVVGLPVCPCGGELLPTEPADLAYIGRIGPDDMPYRDWTVICRENGWDGEIMRKGAAAKVWTAKGTPNIRATKRTCAFTGCGRWIARGEERCAEHSHELMPF